MSITAALLLKGKVLTEEIRQPPIFSNSAGTGRAGAKEKIHPSF